MKYCHSAHLLIPTDPKDIFLNIIYLLNKCLELTLFNIFPENLYILISVRP